MNDMPKFHQCPQRIWTKLVFLGSFKPVLHPSQTRSPGPSWNQIAIQRVAMAFSPEPSVLCQTHSLSVLALKPHWLFSQMLCHVCLGTEVSIAFDHQREKKCFLVLVLHNPHSLMNLVLHISLFVACYVSGEQSCQLENAHLSECTYLY